MPGLKIGFVGVGFMGQVAHLRNYATLQECSVVAIAELRPRLAKLVSERYGVPKVYADLREMLEKEKPDAVVASQPFTRHAALLPEIYPRVKYLFTEKPVAVSVEAGEKLAKTAKKDGCIHMVGYHKRSDPATMFVKEKIDQWNKSGEMGSLQYVRITMPPGDWVASGGIGFIDTDDPRPPLEQEPPIQDMDQKTAVEYVGFVNYYIHQVNLMRHLLGEHYKVKYADQRGRMLAVESASGVPGIIEMSPYNTTIEWEETALIAFDRGYIFLRLPPPLAHNRAGVVELYTDQGGGAAPMRQIPTLPSIDAMRQQAVNFLKLVRGEIAPPCDAREAVEDLKIARDYIRLKYQR